MCKQELKTIIVIKNSQSEIADIEQRAGARFSCDEERELRLLTLNSRVKHNTEGLAKFRAMTFFKGGIYIPCDCNDCRD